ncbi:MAG: hypothetical protein GX591_19760 [Planctomycetes bacterium]|nr:hypothetical protein [Planctomycetota bacterium]
MTLAVDWRPALALAAIVAAAMVLLALARAGLQWWKLRRAKIPLPFGTLLRLRRRGISPGRIAAAHWLTTELGYAIPIDIWVGLTMFHVDIVELAKALALADRHRIATAIGTLGAAAMAGYDPLEVVRAAHRRGLTELTAAHLNELDRWDLTREGEEAPQE